MTLEPWAWSRGIGDWVHEHPLLRARLRAIQHQAFDLAEHVSKMAVPDLAIVIGEPPWMVEKNVPQARQRAFTRHLTAAAAAVRPPLETQGSARKPVDVSSSLRPRPGFNLERVMPAAASAIQEFRKHGVAADVLGQATAEAVSERSMGAAKLLDDLQRGNVNLPVDGPGIPGAASDGAAGPSVLIPPPPKLAPQAYTALAPIRAEATRSPQKTWQGRTAVEAIKWAEGEPLAGPVSFFVGGAGRAYNNIRETRDVKTSDNFRIYGSGAGEVALNLLPGKVLGPILKRAAKPAADFGLKALSRAYDGLSRSEARALIGALSRAAANVNEVRLWRVGGDALPAPPIGPVAPRDLASVANKLVGEPKRFVRSYSQLTKELKGTGLQAHHLNQHAAFGGAIPHHEGLAVGMHGNAFTEAGSPHYEFHSALEEFWDGFRKGGLMVGVKPSVEEYGKALEGALRRAGFTPADAAGLANKAAAQRIAYGLHPSHPVPRVPRPLPQKKIGR